MKNLTLSIMPSYKCNFKCQYCYLGNLIQNDNLLNLENLESSLLELKQLYNIKNVSLYGGELSLLDNVYLQHLVDLIKIKLPKSSISLTSNFSNENILTFCLLNNIKLNVSLNEERYQYSKTLQQIKKYTGTKLFDLTVVVLPSIINKHTNELYKFYNDLGFDVFFIQHHNSIHQKSYSISLDQFSKFLYDFICYHSMQSDAKFKIENLNVLNDTEFNPNTESYLFINPNGKYCTTVFKDNIEHYVTFDNLQQWQTFCEKSYQMYENSCSTCKFFNRCKAEHLETLNNDNECSGLKHLLTSLQNRSIVNL